MSMRHLVCLSAGLALVCASLAHALEFRSVRQTGSVLYQAPVLSGKKLFVVSRYYPVEVLSLQGDWARVRDASGLIAWIQTSALSTLRMVLVVSEQGDVRAAARADAPVVFSVPRNGVLQLLSPPRDGWAHVRHRDGSSGYMSLSNLWGL
jgi:SH3 domain protein